VREVGVEQAKAPKLDGQMADGSGPTVSPKSIKTQNVHECVCHPRVVLDRVGHQLVRVEAHGPRQVGHPGGLAHPEDQQGDLWVVQLPDLL